MLTQHGPVCDICGEYILLDPVESFSVKGIKGTLFAHSPKCWDALQECDKDWRRLPVGPLRKAFEKGGGEDVEKDPGN